MAVLLLSLCAGVSNAATFAYSISCQGQTIGPDQIQAYSQSGSVTLTPNVANVSNTVDFFNGTTNVFFNNLSQSFNSTLLCNFTLGGVTVTANRNFSLVIQSNFPTGSNTPASFSKPLGIALATSETHTFTFQPFSFNVVIPSQGTVTVSQGIHTDSTTISPTTLTAGTATTPATILTVDPASSSLLFVPLAAPIPVSPTFYLTLIGLAAAGWYETKRRKMAALRG